MAVAALAGEFRQTSGALGNLRFDRAAHDNGLIALYIFYELSLISRARRFSS